MTENALRSLVTLETLRTARTYPEFVDWMNQVQAACDDDEDARKNFRLESGAMKKYRDEVLPTRVLADEILARTDVKIRFPADDGDSDVELTGYPGPGSCQRIQVTEAVDGHADRLRMELLSRTGHAPGTGPIRKVGSRKKTGYEIDATGEFEERRERIARHCKFVEERTKEKMLKNYPPGMWLLVSFDDGIRFDAPGYDAIVSAATQAVIPGNFPRFYLVGYLGNGFCRRII